MDLAAADLQNYQLARQLHMLPQLYDVFVSQVMCYPMFYQSLHPAVRQLARVVLLSLNRRFNASASATGEAPVARRYQVDSMRLVLAFLSFPEYHTDRVSCVSRLIAAAPLNKLELGTPMQGVVAAPSGSREATPSTLTPQRADPPIATTTPSELLLPPQVVEDASSGRASGSASPASKPAHPPTAAAAAAVTGVLSRALFFIRPTAATAHADRTAPHFGETAHLYVRMVHPHQLNEESLNPYFGRYGQVDVTPLQRIPVQRYVQYLGETATEALLHLFPSTESGDTLYVQDFIITVDSHQNALYAVRHAYCKELVCIALHDATAGGGSNTHCLADVNNWMRRHAFVWRLRANPRAVASEASAAAAAAAHSSAAAEKRRKRARARRRRHERKMKRRSILGIAVDDTSSTASSEEKVTGKGAGSSASSSGGSSSSDSSFSPTSDGDSAADDLEGFVPDIVIDGFPYWTTEDQLKVLLQQYGTVAEMRLSVDDLSGAFTGCVLVRMASVEEALALSRAVHNILYRGYSLISGVVNERLEVVALEDGREVRVQSIPDQVPPDPTLNERVWV
ncbi:putative RNA-binding, protein [Leishmania major strain Friedlin]|uniref:Putative RNA-binding, protein n=1 Tax=Leishmania major TaxID=5664 RepID=Q4Q4S5_LEIMA|nr:putative RNA-binding, protein [Leishmania major strain Friedlin]CAG9580492.1 RNA-binding_-_protein_-_putative [Leishmania major strain Friedlin]CAJ08878.1 putative RNA-binding, protein [Leishmania major strain Friedlin]|eukprot:XP_001685673.1 putative RNA-binding, protein [Leishmania major strain Friedlin]